MAQDLRAVPRHGIIAPKEAVRMVLEQTAARQAKLLSLLRREGLGPLRIYVQRGGDIQEVGL